MNPQNNSTINRNSVVPEIQPGLTEFGVLLNRFTDPALLVRMDVGEIVLPNSELLKLTAFSRNELVGKSADVLFSEGFLAALTMGEDTTDIIKRRNREPIAVQIHGLLLHAQNQFALIQIVPIDESATIVEPHSDELALDILQLTSSYEGMDLPDALDRMCELTLNMLQLENVTIYQKDAELPQLLRIADNSDDFQFPETVSSTDLIRLALPNEWVPGKRVVTDIHRFSRMNNLGYVISAPFGKSGIPGGLLVAATRNKVPDKDLMGMLEKLAKGINTIYQHQLLSHNLNQENQEQIRLQTLRESLLNNSKEGILILDTSLKVTTLNIAAEEMLGYASREIVGTLVGDVIIGPSGLSKALDLALEGIPTHEIANEQIHRRDGQAFPANLQIIPILQDKVIQGIIIFIIDTSEHEQIQLRTQQLEQRAFLGELMQVFAHEVRNPINNISMGLQLLGDQYKEDPTSQIVIGNAQNDCTRLVHLMESILSFSKQVDQRHESIDIVMLMQRLLDRWRPRLTNLNIQAFFQAEPDLPQVWGYRRSLEQVFVNLFTNSVEAMNEGGGTLAIKICRNMEKASTPQLEISISDTGPGIPDDMRERLFEPFATTKTKGTGLGLAITKQIVNSHKGSIHVSTFPGGTVFHVYLPAANTQQESQKWV